MISPNRRNDKQRLPESHDSSSGSEDNSLETINKFRILIVHIKFGIQKPVMLMPCSLTENGRDTFFALVCATTIENAHTKLVK